MKRKINDSNIQGDFESCTDILISARTPQWITIEPIMPYTNVDIFREKGAKSFSKKSFEAAEFYESPYFLGKLKYRWFVKYTFF
jgi:hypothetical protein